MLHRAILGSLERFIGTLIEHYAGNFPLWLAPNQVAIIPIKDEHQGFAMQVKTALQQADIRVIVDDRNESLSKRIREASVKKIPYQIIIGDKEAQVVPGVCAFAKRKRFRRHEPGGLAGAAEAADY